MMTQNQHVIARYEAIANCAGGRANRGLLRASQ